jgi:hypothetical protein
MRHAAAYQLHFDNLNDAKVLNDILDNTWEEILDDEMRRVQTKMELIENIRRFITQILAEMYYCQKMEA